MGLGWHLGRGKGRGWTGVEVGLVVRSGVRWCLSRGRGLGVGVVVGMGGGCTGGG